jgi:arylsulfatase A-like enzyme
MFAPRQLRVAVVWFWGAVVGCLPTALPAEVRPNLIFILVDDVGRDWLSCYGSDQPTPSLDRLAGRGVRFENVWSTPLCTPSRVEFLTGQYPFRTGWTKHHDAPRWGGPGYDPDRFTGVARVLKSAGYATGIAGKWQINDLRSDPTILQRHGFDEHCLWPGVEQRNPPSQKRYWDALLQTDGKRRTHTGEFGPDVIQRYALDFLRRRRAGPFFLYYPMILAHSPLETLPTADGKPPAVVEKGTVADAMSYLDRQVGELLTELDELGLTEETVIVFAGDNGSASSGSLHGRRIPSGKTKTTDLGVHVPLLIAAPMLSSEARVTEALADFTDLFPTFVELAGVQVPEKLKLDGHSLVPVLQGKSTGERAWIYSQLGERRTVRNHRYKLDSSGALFDLVDDPFEKHDLQESADSAAAAAKQALAKVLAEIPPDAPPPFDGFGGPVPVSTSDSSKN